MVRMKSPTVELSVSRRETYTHRFHPFLRPHRRARPTSASIQTKESSKNKIIIAVMGPAGFINKITGTSGVISHDLEVCTKKLEFIKFSCPGKCHKDLVLIDTPGRDGKNSDGDILNMVLKGLRDKYEGNTTLAGILYLHRISDNRNGLASASLENLSLFKLLCGQNPLRNIILATTMWDDVDENTGQSREKELTDGYWKVMLNQGSTIPRYTNTAESAWSIIDYFIQDAQYHLDISLGQGMIDLAKSLGKRRDLQETYHTLEGLVEDARAILRELHVKRNAEQQSSIPDLKIMFGTKLAQLETAMKGVRASSIHIPPIVEEFLNSRL